MCQNKKALSRNCVICDAKLIGRSDKVYCSLECKNRYHSTVRKQFKSISSETVRILARNHHILVGLMSDKTNNFIIDRLALERLGFKLKYISGVTLINSAMTYFVFDYSYTLLTDNRIVVTASKDRKPMSPFIFKRWNAVYQEL